MIQIKKIHIKIEKLEKINIILDAKIGTKERTLQNIIDEVLDNFDDLVNPSFVKYYEIDLLMQSHLQLTNSKIIHFFNEELKSCLYELTFINLILIELLNQNNMLERILEKEEDRKISITDYYDQKYNYERIQND